MRVEALDEVPRRHGPDVQLFSYPYGHDMDIRNPCPNLFIYRSSACDGVDVACAEHARVGLVRLGRDVADSRRQPQGCASGKG